MKFTKKSLLETLRLKIEGKSSYRARRIAKVSVRRVDELWKEYLMTGDIPAIGKGVGRPMIPIEEWEKALVKKFYEKYRVSADILERLIERDENKKLYVIHPPIKMGGFLAGNLNKYQLFSN